jgi:Ca-activated chloride channel family protein
LLSKTCMNKKHLFFIACTVLFTIFFSAFSLVPQTGYQQSALVSDTTLPFIRAKDHKGKSAIATSGVITFTTGLDNDYYQVDSVNKSVYFYVEAKLSKLLNAPVKRTPLNISIAIDRSGSMQGVKMGYAKKAAKAIIDLLEPEDFVSVVMYDHAIDSVQEPVAVNNKDMIKAKIDRIVPRGGTNLWGGTERGYQYVLKNYKPGCINRVLLISDGLANIGTTDSLVIRQKVRKFKDDDGVTLSTFGVGLDYNESLMTDMAETGAGNYYFIDAPDHMLALFQKELNGMLNVIAQNAELKIKLPKGVRIEKSYPLKYTQIGDVVIVKLLDLFAEETKSTLFKFQIEDKTNAPLKFLTTLSYTDIMDGQQKSVTNENLLGPVKNSEPYLTHFNKPVVEQTIFLTANENLENAMSQVDKKDFAGARRALDANKAYLKANAYYLGGYPMLRNLDSVNTKYAYTISSVNNMSEDSLKKFQKLTKAANYKLRNKKQ